MDWREWDALRTIRTRELDIGLVFEAAAVRKWWLIGLPLAALVLIGAVLCLQPPIYSAETQVLFGPRQAGLIGLRSSVALLDGAGGYAAASQVQLIASRDLARRAIKDLGINDNPEFDPVTSGLGPGLRTLIFFGIVGDPARKNPEERVLEAFSDRLRVTKPGREGLVKIAFQSGDPELAANAANRIAELYLEMRAGAKHAAELPRNTAARIVSRAAAPQHPLYPRGALLTFWGAAMLVVGFGALVSTALPRGRPFRAEVPVEQPRALGDVRVFARFKYAAGLSPRSNPNLDPQPVIEGETAADDPDNGQVMTKIVRRILATPARGTQAIRQGIRIVATSLEAPSAASCVTLGIARDLAREGRSIAICLDRSALLHSASFAAGAPHRDSPGNERALGDLLAGTASFAEVICRDPASRLHFLPVGRNSELDLHEFANVLDALAGIYDFIVTIAPPFGLNGIAGALAAKADVVLLAAPGEPHPGAAFEAERQLIESGAREVLLIGMPAESPQSLGLDAA